MNIRPERVAKAILREVSAILRDDLKDPRIGFTTITKVEITPDIRHAQIYYSVLGNEKQKRSTEIALKSANGFIKTLIGRRLKLRFTPEIAFIVDRSLEHQDRIDRLIERIHKEKEQTQDS